jgi:hypothetical protein
MWRQPLLNWTRQKATSTQFLVTAQAAKYLEVTAAVVSKVTLTLRIKNGSLDLSVAVLLFLRVTFR